MTTKRLSEQVADLENELESRIAKPSILAMSWETAYFQLLQKYVDERMTTLKTTNPDVYEFLNTPVDALAAVRGAGGEGA